MYYEFRKNLSLEKTFPTQEKFKENLKNSIKNFLEIPERIGKSNKDKNLGKELGDFLVDKGYVENIDMWRGSWGFKYKNKIISIADREMPEKAYDYYIFRLGTDSVNGETLFPERNETNHYRFLHEIGHAYQEYLVDKESQNNGIDPSLWYDMAVKGEIDSNYSVLFNFCYENRRDNKGKGLSTWGNVPDYDAIKDINNRNVARAIEDANEMVVMRIWHPEYLDAFLDSVSLENPRFSEIHLERDRLTKISGETKELLKALINMYVDEMKSEIGVVNNK